MAITDGGRIPDYHDLEALRRTHPAWRLLRADHAPFVVSFLSATFVAPNRRAIAQHELASLLDDHLFRLREGGLGEEAFPLSAPAYLDAWASDENAWLRKYYLAGSDEAHFDVTPATERAIEWVTGLERRRFVGTESRLLTIFDLLRQIVEGTRVDRASRASDIEKRIATLEAELAAVRAGEISVMDDARIRDRFLQVESTARQLLADFRQVEQNFRELDRSARERIAQWEGGKGELLHELFGDRDAIADSDEGRSFRGFWDFLTSSVRQDELSTLMHAAFDLEAIARLKPDRRLLRVHFDWLEAGEVAQRTVARLSEQLRRLIDDRMLLENRRTAQLIREIEGHAIAVRENAPQDAAFAWLDDAAPSLALPMDRRLFHPQAKLRLTDGVVAAGEAGAPPEALFDRIYIDKQLLATRIRRALALRDRLSLSELLAEHPLEHGLAELVSYLSLAVDDPASLIDDRYEQQIDWTDGDGTRRRAFVPLVVFARDVVIAASVQST